MSLLLNPRSKMPEFYIRILIFEYFNVTKCSNKVKILHLPVIIEERNSLSGSLFDLLCVYFVVYKDNVQTQHFSGWEEI